MDDGFNYAEAFKTPRSERRHPGPARPDDRLAGLVAGRFRSLRRPVHPPGVAQRGHLSHHRRPRRRRRRAAALRAAEQLAGQREPRQGAPAAVADQAEIRQQDLLGRPVRPGRQRRPGIRWASRRSASPAAAPDTWEPEELYWGPEGTWLGDERYSGERAAAEPARRGADGPHLRQSGRARTASPIRSARRATSARPSRAWR